MQPAPNQVLAGKYRLSRQLGQGGMGSVWLAEHLTLRSPVAIKLIEPSIAANPEALARFLREAQAAASLRSPHVVQILDHGVDGNVPFIVMEVLEGEPLASRLKRMGRLSPAETAKLLTDVARAMTRAHEAGVVHRDLKPDNIFIVRNDEEEIAKVLDFGVAKSSSHGLGAAAGSGTRTGAVLGTPYYMSPEQAEGTKTLDQRTDIWAMGVIAWECLLGSQPFDAETLGGLLLAICAREMPVPSQRGVVPPGFDAWFARACSRDPGGRFPTAKEAAAELRRVCGDARFVPQGPSVALPAPQLTRTTSNLNVSALPRPSSKLPGVLLVGMVLLGLAVAAVGGAVLLRGRSAPAGSAAGTELVPSAVPSAPALTLAPSAASPADSVKPALAVPGLPSATPAAPKVASPDAAAPPAHAAPPAPSRPTPAQPKSPPRPAASPAAPGPANVDLGI